MGFNPFNPDIIIILLQNVREYVAGQTLPKEGTKLTYSKFDVGLSFTIWQTQALANYYKYGLQWQFKMSRVNFVIVFKSNWIIKERENTIVYEKMWLVYINKMSQNDLQW